MNYVNGIVRIMWSLLRVSLMLLKKLSLSHELLSHLVFLPECRNNQLHKKSFPPLSYELLGHIKEVFLPEY